MTVETPVKTPDVSPSSTQAVVATHRVPRLEDWFEIIGRLCGIIYDDDRFPNGTRVLTSSIIDINAAMARTRSGTLYILGRRVRPPEDPAAYLAGFRW